MLKLVPFLAEGFQKLLTFLVSFVTVKQALIIASIGSLTAIFLLFVGVINGLTYGLSASIPSWAVTGLMFIPENVSACISALVTAKLGRFVYEYQKEYLHLLARAA